MIMPKEVKPKLMCQCGFEGRMTRCNGFLKCPVCGGRWNNPDKNELEMTKTMKIRREDKLRAERMKIEVDRVEGEERAKKAEERQRQEEDRRKEMEERKRYETRRLIHDVYNEGSSGEDLDDDLDDGQTSLGDFE